MPTESASRTGAKRRPRVATSWSCKGNLVFCMAAITYHSLMQRNYTESYFTEHYNLDNYTEFNRDYTLRESCRAVVAKLKVQRSNPARTDHERSNGPSELRLNRRYRPAG
jgi:hypothetical protein